MHLIKTKILSRVWESHIEAKGGIWVQTAACFQRSLEAEARQNLRASKGFAFEALGAGKKVINGASSFGSTAEAPRRAARKHPGSTTAAPRKHDRKTSGSMHKHRQTKERGKQDGEINAHTHTPRTSHT